MNPARLLVAACLSAALAAPAAEPTPAHQRYALVITVGQYDDPAIPRLVGMPKDLASAQRMAAQMGVPRDHVQVLSDGAASYANIRSALRAQARRLAQGDRLFVYFSGHGSRFADPDRPESCREALLPADIRLSSRKGVLTEEDVAADLAPAYAKADKIVVFLDACHSGGVQAAGATRAFAGRLVAKSVDMAAAARCVVASNVRMRSIGEAALARGIPSNNVVQIASSRSDEISFDNPVEGGLATSSWSYCSMYADDTDGSGSLSVQEIADCVQRRMEARLAGNPDLLGQHLVVTGNAAFSPLLADEERPGDAAPGVAPEPAAAGDVAVPAATATAPPALSGPPSTPPAAIADTGASQPAPMAVPAIGVAPQVASSRRQRFPLDSVLAQADGHVRVDIEADRRPLRIGADAVRLRIRSSRAGYVYLFEQGSGEAATTVLFPNALDQRNRIEAGQAMDLPRPRWRIQAVGPAGTDRILALVTDTPLDLAALHAESDGPFMKTLGDQASARALAWILGSTSSAGTGACAPGFRGKDLVRVEDCAQAFGARLIEFQEVGLD